MSKRTLALSLLVGSLLAPSASANIGALDPAPSATLLFPYLEADPAAGGTRDTRIIVENAAAASQLTHVIVWTDLGVPVFDFDVYLPAKGRLELSLRALLAGEVPESAPYSDAGCAIPRAPLSPDEVADLGAALTGQRLPSATSEGLGCPGVDHGDALARGYVTVDVVSECGTSDEVADGSYWGTKLAHENALIGSFTIHEGDGRPSYAEQAVHVEASLAHEATDGVVDIDGFPDRTFYGFLVGYSGNDHRESLPTLWNTSYSAARSDLVVWRESKRALLDPAAVTCGFAQAALALDSNNVFYVDESEQMVEHGGSLPFPRATGRYPAGGAEGLPVPYRAGAVLSNLNFDVADVPISVAGFAQSVVLSATRPDAVGDAVHGTLAYGTPIDDGIREDSGWVAPAGFDVGGVSYTSNLAMMDLQPAATLVLPYFEVALDDPNRATTELRIVNTGASARLAKLTLFTDRGVPTESFMVYLTGFDIEAIDLRLLFEAGLVPRTASDGQDPTDTVSPQGPKSQDINFASCFSRLPFERLDDERVAFLRAAHTGQPVVAWEDRCGGRTLGDDIARGYVVIDDYKACTDGPFVPEHATSIFGDRDGLAGSFAVRNRADDLSWGGALLPLHRAGGALDSGDVSFYGWLDGWANAGTSEPREPLPGAFRVPFVNGPDTGESELVLFRPVHRAPEPYACDAAPASFEGTLSVTAFDDADNSSVLAAFVPGFVAGRVSLAPDELVVPYARGALEVDLDFAEAGGPSSAPDAHMGFVGVIQRPSGSADATFLPGSPLRRAGEQ